MRFVGEEGAGSARLPFTATTGVSPWATVFHRNAILPSPKKTMRFLKMECSCKANKAAKASCTTQTFAFLRYLRVAMSGKRANGALSNYGAEHLLQRGIDRGPRKKRNSCLTS